MSRLGQKRKRLSPNGMSALPSTADVRRLISMSISCQNRTFVEA
jgi:hypothetical protein